MVFYKQIHKETFSFLHLIHKIDFKSSLVLYSSLHALKMQRRHSSRMIIHVLPFENWQLRPLNRSSLKKKVIAIQIMLFSHTWSFYYL